MLKFDHYEVTVVSNMAQSHFNKWNFQIQWIILHWVSHLQSTQVNLGSKIYNVP